jgi:DNA-binding response OmpR family regulator
MKLGAMDYLVKPRGTEELVTKINKVYQRKAEQEERIREAKVKGIISSPRSVLREEQGTRKCTQVNIHGMGFVEGKNAVKYSA